MDNTRFLVAVLLSVAILLGYQMLVPPPPAPHQAGAPIQAAPSAELPRPVGKPAFFTGNHPDSEQVPQNAPRVRIEAPLVEGSVNLVGARLDDLVMRHYHVTSDPRSPNWTLLAPRAGARPSYVQFGWASDDPHVKVPDNDTVWTGSGGGLTPAHPVLLSWNNGQGLLFQIGLSIDAHYMFGVQQSVRNTGATPVALHAWARVRRDDMPAPTRREFLHEGPTGFINGRLHELTYRAVCKPERAPTEQQTGSAPDGKPPSPCAAVRPLGDEVAFTEQGQGGWTGIADTYMLTALIPDQAALATVAYRYLPTGEHDRFQVDMIDDAPRIAQPGGGAVTAGSHVFAGAMEIRLLDGYGRQYGIPGFDKAIDFGWLYLLTKPILYALTWLNGLIGHFALTLLTFTVIVKLLLFPLTNYSFKSMRKMSLLGPKMTQIRERHKDDPARMQTELAAIFRNEGVNPVSGCLPVLLQAPVFIALYNVIYIDIDIWHAPFPGWISDMSVADPTNLFNLFGALPFNPTDILPFLDLGAWPVILGFTMYLQQMFNPPPADPTQARMFKFMPVLFTFFFARLPAGLVIYYSWSNLLTVVQQWMMKRSLAVNTPRRIART